MHATITINADVLQHANQVLERTPFSNVEEFITFLIEAKLKEMSPPKQDLIRRLRGKLKGKQGGTEAFMRDKQAEIDMEYHL